MLLVLLDFLKNGQNLLTEYFYFFVICLREMQIFFLSQETPRSVCASESSSKDVPLHFRKDQ